MVLILLFALYLVSKGIPDTECPYCDGSGSYIYPDGLSAHPCDACKGTGKNQTIL